jgi:predicted transglutaminase-like cysteine proteinase
VLSRRHLLCGLGGLGAVAVLPAAARAAMSGAPAPLPHSTPMSVGELVPAPAAWFHLLRQNPQLDPGSAAFEPVKLSASRSAALIKVNRAVNTAMRFRNDADRDLWEVGGREGDCEDFAIRKLRDLTRHHDFPRGALTLAACSLDYGRGHAVLLVHSDKGVYVMDNLTPRVLPWRKLPYRWVAREEPGAPFRLWRALA